MATEWTISIEGTNEFGDTSRREFQIYKSDERLRDGDLGLSIDDGKKIMATLQSAVIPTQDVFPSCLHRGAVMPSPKNTTIFGQDFSA